MTVACSKAGGDDWAALFSVGVVGALSDGELLARFARGGGDASSEAAFAALVDRHGPLVLGVCRRVTGDRHAADDAFQAVFVVLARKARSVRLGADDSLGRWLYGVSLRVARRARKAASRRPPATRDLDGLDPIDPSPSLDPCERADLRAAIDAEIARLPARYRAAVVLCQLEGLSQEQAARRLRCPVGTVQSRLHRARERLRSGLARRGLAPAVAGLAGGILGPASRAAVPPDLAKGTAAAAAGISAGEAPAGLVSAAVAGLVEVTSRDLMMRSSRMIAVLLALLLVAAGGAVVLATVGDDGPAARATVAGAKAQAAPPGPSLAEQLDRIQKEYEDADRAYHELYRGSTIPEENRAKAAEIRPDLPGAVRRITGLASADAEGPAARDAMLWIIRQAGSSAADGAGAGEFALAANWLVRHHGDDPDAVRAGLELANVPSAHRDNLLLGFYASTKGRESKGLARMALAQYLEMKAKMAQWARKAEGRQTITYVGVVGEDGKPYDLKQEQSDEAYAYLLHLKQCDVGYLRSEADRLYREVISEYGDIPYATSHERRLEALLRQPEPTWNGEPLTDEDRRKLEERLARRPTLRQVAESRLDDRNNLAEGSPAPEIEGADLEGRPRKLSDYRGKVVALVFWGSWCGPCMREIPREKALVGRMQGRPFAMLGVNTDEDADAAREVMKAEGIAWPNWHDGEPGDGPIARRYHVGGYPTVFVIDAEGKIRSKKSLGDALDSLVEKLVAETEQKAAGPE